MTALLSAAPARNRRVIMLGLAAITVLSWAYLLLLSARMGDMNSSFAMPMTSAWGLHDIVLMWTMWAVTMAGMMLPSVVRHTSTAVFLLQSFDSSPSVRYILHAR